jgi:dephospho-CoA kinase
MSKFVVLAGKSGVGKSHLAARLRHDSVKAANVGDVISAILESHGIAFENRRAAGDLFLRKFGERRLVDLLELVAKDADCLILDGLRLPGVYRRLKGRGHSVYVVSVSCAEHERRKRLIDRDGKIEGDQIYDKRIEWLCNRAQARVHYGVGLNAANFDLSRQTQLQRFLERIEVCQDVIYDIAIYYASCILSFLLSLILLEQLPTSSRDTMVFRERILNLRVPRFVPFFTTKV